MRMVGQRQEIRICKVSKKVALELRSNHIKCFGRKGLWKMRNAAELREISLL